MKLHKIFFFLLLVFLPSQLGLHFWPEWSMVLGRRVDYLSPTLYLTDIIIFLILFFWFFDYLKKISSLKSSIKKIINQNRVFILILFLVYVFLNIFFSRNSLVAGYKWLKILEFVLLGFYIVKSKPEILFVTMGLAIGIFYSSLIAIFQFILQGSVGGPLWWLGERTFNASTPGIARITLCNPLSESCSLRLRPYAAFPHPNVLAGFLVATIPVLIVQFSKSSILKLSKKIFFLSSIFLGIAALILTFSRSGLIAGSLTIIIASYKTVKSKIFRKILFTIGTILIIFSFFLLRTISFLDESVAVREQLNVVAMKFWQEFPLFGTGMGNFLVKLPESLPLHTVYFLQPVHNILLLILAEAGIVGLLFFLYIVLKALKNFSFSTKTAFPIFKLSLVTLILLGLVDHYLLTLQQGELLLTLIFSLALVF